MLPILEYCCLNKLCKPCQFTFMGSKEWYHNLASPNSVKQNLWTLTPSIKWLWVHPVVSAKQMSFCILIRFSRKFWLKMGPVQVYYLLHRLCLLLWSLWFWWFHRGWKEIRCWNALHLWSWLCHILFTFNLLYLCYIIF